jgi:beta-phosphoglucomutase-like phosphatase (HAD superfamily)
MTRRLRLPDAISACLFDLDGVLARTAELHAAAWKQTFDDFLRNRIGLARSASAPFDAVADDVVVDGALARELGLAGKPSPDVFLQAARRLGVAPRQAAVFEDALAGVAAGRAGGFGLVVGVDRAGQADEHRAAGADTVVADLAELIGAP